MGEIMTMTAEKVREMVGFFILCALTGKKNCDDD